MWPLADGRRPSPPLPSPKLRQELRGCKSKSWRSPSGPKSRRTPLVRTQVPTDPPPRQDPSPDGPPSSGPKSRRTLPPSRPKPRRTPLVRTQVLTDPLVRTQVLTDPPRQDLNPDGPQFARTQVPTEPVKTQVPTDPPRQDPSPDGPPLVRTQVLMEDPLTGRVCA